MELGEKWSFAMSMTIPYVWMDVSGDVAATLPNGTPVSVRRTDTVDGFGDIVIMPLMLNYNVSPDFNMRSIMIR